jgi:hypothetical protein
LDCQTMTIKNNSTKKTFVAASRFRDSSSRVRPVVPTTIIGTTTKTKAPVPLPPLPQHGLVVTPGGGSNRRDVHTSMQGVGLASKIPRKKNQRRNPPLLLADTVVVTKKTSSVAALPDCSTSTVSKKNTKGSDRNKMKKEMHVVLTPAIIKKPGVAGAAPTNKLLLPSTSIRSSMSSTCAKKSDHAVAMHSTHHRRTNTPAAVGVTKNTGIRVMRAPPGSKWRATCASRQNHTSRVKKNSKWL